MNTQYRKNLKAVLEASKTYCDESISNLKWELGTYDLSVDTNTNTAHIKTLPSGTIQTTVAKVEGVGYKVNQLVANGNFASVTYWTNITRVENNQGVLQGNSAFNYFFQTNTITSGHKYLCVGTIKSDTLGIGFFGDADGSPTYINSAITTVNTWELKASIFTASSNRFRLAPLRMGSYSGSETYTAYCKNVMLFDLTAMGIDTTDVSTATSELAKRNIYLDVYETYNLDSIKNNSFTGATVEGSNKYDYGTANDYIKEGTSEIFDLNNHIQFKIGVGAGNFYINKTKHNNGTYTLSYTYTSVPNATPRILLRFYDINNQIITSSFSGWNYNIYYQAYYPATISNTYTFTTPSNVAYFYVGFSGANSNYQLITYENVMLNYGSTAMAYIPYTSQTIPIDLTTIKDSNNVSLFPSGKLMGNSNVADFITPYNQESRWNEEDFSTLTFVYLSNYGVWRADLLDVKNRGNAIATNYVYNDVNPSLINEGEFTLYYSWYGATPSVFVKNGSSTTPPTGILQYERATYLTSNTDLTSLTKINAQSNGTITLNNTDNVDMPNTIDYLIEEVKA